MYQRKDPRRSAAALAVAFGAVLAPVHGCAGGEPPAFSADSAWVHIERQVAMGPRVPGTAARDSAAVYLARSLRRAGARVTVQAFEIDDPYRPGRLRLVNVIGSFAPDRRRRAMLAAHYDSRPWADEEADSALWRLPVPAAVDGASGVAVLLEVARLVGAVAPGAIGVDLVFFDGEDYGKRGDHHQYLLGSKHFAANLAGYRPDFAVLVDMIGGEGTRIRREEFSMREAPALVQHVFALAASLGLDYFEPSDGGPVYDDHVPLLQAGIEAVDLFGYGYLYWHTLRDTPERCSRERLAQVGTLLRELLYNSPYEPH